MAPHRIVVAETDHGGDAHPQLNMNNTWIFPVAMRALLGKGTWHLEAFRQETAPGAQGRLVGLGARLVEPQGQRLRPMDSPLVHRSPNGTNT